MIEIFHIDVGQTTPALEAACIDEDGHLVHLGGCSVTFTLRRLGGAVIFTRSATIVSAPTGYVRYQWQAGDTTTEGRYLGQFTATFPSLDVIDFPSDRFIRVEVL